MPETTASPALRLVINEAEFRKLCADKTITATVMVVGGGAGGQPIQIALDGFGLKEMFAAVSNLMFGDPPQAREFLPLPKRRPRR